MLKKGQEGAVGNLMSGMTGHEAVATGAVGKKSRRIETAGCRLGGKLMQVCGFGTVLGLQCGGGRLSPMA